MWNTEALNPEAWRLCMLPVAFCLRLVFWLQKMLHSLVFFRWGLAAALAGLATYFLTPRQAAWPTSLMIRDKQNFGSWKIWEVEESEVDTKMKDYVFCFASRLQIWQSWTKKGHFSREKNDDALGSEGQTIKVFVRLSDDESASILMLSTRLFNQKLIQCPSRTRATETSSTLPAQLPLVWEVHAKHAQNCLRILHSIASSFSESLALRNTSYLTASGSLVGEPALNGETVWRQTSV